MAISCINWLKNMVSTLPSIATTHGSKTVVVNLGLTSRYSEETETLSIHFFEQACTLHIKAEGLTLNVMTDGFCKLKLAKPSQRLDLKEST